MSQLVQPHFSETLRTFSGVAADEQCFDEPADAILQKKEVQNERRLKKSSASWNFVKQTILSVRDKSDTEVIVALRELLHYAQEFAGGDCLEEVIQSAALLLLDTFQESEDNGLVSDRQRQLLRTTFGSFPPDLPNRAHSLVRKIFSWLPPETRDLLLEQKNSIEDQFPESAEFTRKLKVGGFVPFVDDEIEVCSEDELFVKDQARLDMSYKTPVLQNGVSRKPKNRYNSSWLREQVQTVLADNSALGLSVEEIVNVVTPMLDSHRTDKELEGEMFEFFGAEFLGVIHNILDHRKELVKAINAEALSTGDAFPDVPALKNQPTKPTYGCQVTVQSEQEKALMKKIQKEEKRIGRDRMKNTKDQEDEVQLNVEFLRRQKHAELNAELKTVKEAPLLPRRPQVYVERYPNVYDSFAEAKKSAAFIAGTKLALPTDCKVKSTGKYEEVSIPLSKPPPPNVGNKLVKVADLDEVCRIGFKGVETLNRIQSIVFDTVYNTNENLLICAPTGAGKTNVAMLAILHEVKQHVDGKGLGSNFKVVYVAPMKALAAEMVRNFGKKLEPLGVVVRELTGDMQLSKAEIMKTHMLVTTPEKWDVVTRKSTGDIALNQIVKLLILDEVHLLHGDRGPVLEALVARTLRQVESSQRMIRIVGLSATLPNYEDVAHFLRVNPRMGLFYFDNRFRPVPLGQTFIGVKATSNLQQMTDMDEVCFDRVFSVVQKGFQVMVFVHSRNSTVKTARALRELAQQQGKLPKFQVVQSVQYVNAEKQMMHSRNSAIKDLFPYGFSIHHAGMLRCDRNLVEKLFSEGMINVLVCTSTLAWGVNLPAHAVIIKGTDIYDSKHGSFVDLDILDVMQIFGRAGRPQFDKEGHGTIITTHAKLNKYLSLLTCQFPIESNFHQNLMDNLNAEISLGTVSTVSEAVEWLSYTYLFVRMRRNPLVYGIKCTSLLEDPTLCQYRRDLVISAAKTLDKARMIRFDAKSESLDSTNLGRTASHFYIKHATVEHFNDLLERKCLTEGDILAAVSKAQEFDQLQGTDIYDSKHGSFVDLDILDVMQIFGRAGRPQFDKEGHGTIITTHAKLNKYLSLLTCQFPIESNFHQNLMDNLNAEISLGTVSTVSEAVEWLSYTYLFVRMRRNPLVYGIKCTSLLEDPTLCQYRRDLVISAAKTLDKARMIRFDAKSESLDSTNLGRTASHFYIKHATVEHFNDLLERKCLTEGDILAAVSKAQEFDQLQVREDELPELDLLLDVSCKLSVAGGSENSFGKVNILLQNFISRGPVESFSLISDQAYIVQNATRILRALFDMVLRAGGAIMAGRILTLCKAVERQVWSFESPLKQFPDIGYHVLKHIEEKDIRVDYIKDMGAKDIGMMVHNPKVGTQVELCARQIPQLVVVPRIQPITRTVIKVQLDITADFRWSDRVHKGAEAFWIWVEDPNSDEIYHYEYFVLTKMQVCSRPSPPE
ncbi:activating signal cointegrator 1 complex subunit 3 [Ixodes scapularis]